MTLLIFGKPCVLMHAFRSNPLKETGLATATFETIRLKLLKTGARIVERKTKIDVPFPTAHPCQGLSPGALPSSGICVQCPGHHPL
jgi:hypothetical protein